MKKSFIISLCCICFFKALFCQKLYPPRVIRVTVQPFTDLVTIEWKDTSSAPIDGYLLYEHHFNPDLIYSQNPYSELRFDTVESITTKATFNYPSVRNQPIMFWVASYKGIKPSPSDGNYHRTIFTQGSYDSCNMEVTLKWTKYVGWGSNLKYYKIFQAVDNTTNISVIKDVIAPNDTFLTVSVQPNKNYWFYVCAVNSDATINSFSNDTLIFTRSANAPAYINANSASFDPNSKTPVHLKFTVDPASQIKKYQLLVSDNSDGNFTPLKGPLTILSNSIDIQDSTIGTSPRYYRLDALNFCGKSTTQSNIATAIIPKLTGQSNEAHLIWNEYKGWYQGVAQYDIFRQIGSDAPQNIRNTGANTFSDNVSSLMAQQYSGNICYYVEAVSKQDSVGQTFRSRSSTSCIDLSESVFVPTGFTPNGDTRNDVFRPSFAFSPKEFTMVVYNRYGFKVFETKQQFNGTKGELANGWDGTIGGSQRAPEGTYVYLIRFITQSGKTVERNGSFSLIYP